MSQNEQLGIDITAKDSASKVVDPLLKKVDKLDQSDPEIDVTADTRKADHTVDSFADQLDKLTDTDKVVVLSLRAAAATAELRDIATDLATIDQADPDIDVKFARYAEVSGQLDQLDAQMKSLGDGADSEKVNRRLDDIAGGADRAGEAVHSFAGNAIGDFAATATGIGPLGEAISQISEQAIGAESGIKNIVKAAAGAGGIAATLYVIQQTMSAIAEERAFRSDRVDAYTKSLRDGVDAAQALADRLNDAGKVMGSPSLNNASNFLGLSDAVRDVTNNVTLAGLSIDQYAQLAAEGQAAIEAWGQAQLDAGANGKLIAGVVLQLNEEHDDLTTAQTNAGNSAKFFKDEQNKAAASMGTAAIKAAGLGGASRKLAADFDHASASYRGLTQQFDDESAWLNLQDSFDRARDAANEAATATDGQAEAQRRARQAVLDNIDALAQYATEVLGLPTEQTTQIVALVNQGKLDEAEALLDNATKTRTAWINVQVNALMGALTGALTRVGGSGGSPVPGVVNLTQVLPRGFHGDALAAAQDTARRSGGMFQRRHR